MILCCTAKSKFYFSPSIYSCVCTISSRPFLLRLDCRQVCSPTATAHCQGERVLTRLRGPDVSSGWTGGTIGSLGPVEVPLGGWGWGVGRGLEVPPQPPAPLRPGLFLGSVAQCVAWLWARAASLPASASLPPLRPKTKLGHSQTLHALCLSLHHSPPHSRLSFSSQSLGVIVSLFLFWFFSFITPSHFFLPLYFLSLLFYPTPILCYVYLSSLVCFVFYHFTLSVSLLISHQCPEFLAHHLTYMYTHTQTHIYIHSHKHIYTLSVSIQAPTHKMYYCSSPI